MCVSKLYEPSSLALIQNSKQKVVEDTFFDIWKFSVDESLFQEEVDQRSLVVNVSQGSQAFQDAGDAQVVMCATKEKSNQSK